MRFLYKTTALIVLLCAQQSQVVKAALGSGFEDREVLIDGSGGGIITDFAWTPQGQLLVAKKNGEIQVHSDPDNDNLYKKDAVALDLSSVLCANSERGVEGIEVHPDFLNNRYM